MTHSEQSPLLATAGGQPSMNETANASTHWRLRIRRPSLVEWFVFVVIGAVLVALLVPGGQWVADGSIEVPVRVRVFDAATAKSIPAADVVPFFGPSPDETFSIDEYRDWFPRDNPLLLKTGNVHVTDNDGTVVISSEFPTTASHKRPETVAHVRGWWLMISAKGFGAAAVPVRYESVPTKVIREQGELFVAVGLMPSE